MTASPPKTEVSPYRFKSSRWSSHAVILRLLPERGDGRRVLDAGCGPGYLGAALAARGYRVTGIEKSAAPDFPDSVDLVQADLESGLPPLPGRFDYVLCGDVIEHLRDPLDFLRSLRSKLAPGGKLVASVPNGVHAYVRLHVLLGRFPKHDRGLFDRTHLHFFSWSGWTGLFARSGWRIENVAVTPVPFTLVAGEGRLGALLERIAWIAARAWPGMFAYQYVATARVEEP